MNLLAAKLYDPAAAVTKATSALLAMTALDTTNLRLAITVPAHGMVRFKLQGIVHGATTFPSILLGVMNGATVLGRVAPVQSLGNTAVATAMVNVEAEFTVTGLTPGAMNVDAAYGVETVIAATGIKYGGPNNTTANDAFGGFLFEAWDPQPLKAALDGGVNVTQFGGAAGTFAGGRPEVNASHWRGTALAAPTTAGIPRVAVEAAADFAQGAADKVWSTAARTLTSFGTLVADIWDRLTSALTTVGSIGKLLVDNIDAAVSSRLATAGYTAPPSAAAIRAEIDANSTKLDVAVSTRLAAAGYTAPDNASITAIKAKTDSLTFTVAGKLDVNVLVGQRRHRDRHRRRG